MICCGLDLKYWDDVKDGLQLALDVDDNKYSLDDLKKAIEEKDMQLWCIHDGNLLCSFVTQIVNYPQKRILDCVALTGKNPTIWIGFLLSQMEKYGKENNCDFMQTGGRKGWEKLFKKHGWKNFHIKMSRSIDYA
jgi:hypothetical protein